MAQKILSSTTGAALFVVAAGALGGFLLFNSPKESETPSLFGIPLVPPIFAQGTPADFPDPDAGLSAYLKFDSAVVDLDAAVNNAFTDVLFAGDNYVIGNVVTKTSSKLFGDKSDIHVNVSVYVDTDGFIIAYFPRGTQNAWIFDWNEWDSANPILKTTFEEAMDAVAQAAADQNITGMPISWYNWAYPEATHLLAAAKIIDPAAEVLFVSIPPNVTILDAPSYSYTSGRVMGPGGTIPMNLVIKRSDGQIRNAGTGFVVDLILEPNFTYTFQNGMSPSSDVGIAIVYRVE